MERDRRQTIDEVVNDIDELKTAVEELQDDSVAADERATLDRLKSALDEATAAGDDLEDRDD
jgi:hypothetical protein